MLEPHPLKDHRYAILGATGGIGEALCRRLHDSGASLFLGARTPDRLNALATALDCSAKTVDATSFDSTSDFIKSAVDEMKGLDGVALCVGSLFLKAAHQTSQDEWNTHIAQNLTAAFSTLRAGTQALMERGGSIVLFSSAAAEVGLVNHEVIAAAKAGIEGLTRAAAATYARYQIRVNAVAPGLTRTPMTERLTSFEPALKKSAAMHALGRIGTPEDVASAAYWLLSPQQSWVTGQILGVDGGLSCIRPRD